VTARARKSGRPRRGRDRLDERRVHVLQLVGDQRRSRRQRQGGGRVRVPARHDPVGDSAAGSPGSGSSRRAESPWPAPRTQASAPAARRRARRSFAPGPRGSQGSTAPVGASARGGSDGGRSTDGRTRVPATPGALPSGGGTGAATTMAAARGLACRAVSGHGHAARPGWLSSVNGLAAGRRCVGDCTAHWRERTRIQIEGRFGPGHGVDLEAVKHPGDRADPRRDPPSTSSWATRSSRSQAADLPRFDRGRSWSACLRGPIAGALTGVPLEPDLAVRPGDRRRDESARSRSRPGVIGLLAGLWGHLGIYKSRPASGPRSIWLRWSAPQ